MPRLRSRCLDGHHEPHERKERARQLLELSGIRSFWPQVVNLQVGEEQRWQFALGKGTDLRRQAAVATERWRFPAGAVADTVLRALQSFQPARRASPSHRTKRAAAPCNERLGEHVDRDELASPFTDATADRRPRLARQPCTAASGLARPTGLERHLRTVKRLRVSRRLSPRPSAAPRALSKFPTQG